MTFLTLEFDTGSSGAAPLGDIASSLVAVDELLRDLATIAADPSNPEYRNIEVVGIEMRSPLKVTLSLFAISADVVRAFQEISRDILLRRERHDHASGSARNIASALGVDDDRVTPAEAERILRHMLTLQNAEVPLRRVEISQ